MKKEHSWAFLIITVAGLLFVTLSGSVFSGYHFMDCNDYFEWERDLSEMSWWKCVGKHIESEMDMRFRPAWQLNALVKTLMFHDNMLLHGFWQLFLNIVAAFLIYLFGRRIHWSFKESLLFAGLSLIGTQSAVFYQTMAIESPALIILLLSWHFVLIYFNTSKGAGKILSYTVFIALSILTVLMKENFILALPATYVLFCMQYSEKYQTGFGETVFHTWKTGLFLLFLTGSCLWAVLAFAGNDFGYAGMNGNLPSYLKCIIYFCGISGCLFAFAAVGYLSVNRQISYNNWLFPVLWFLAITVPQIIIYGKSNIIDRYLIPAIVGCAYFSVFIYREIKRQDKPINKSLWKTISLALGAVLLFFCSLIIFSQPFRENIIRIAVHLQGKEVQTMTSVASLQYLSDSLPIISITGLIIGSILLTAGFLKKNHFIGKASQLYLMIFILLLLFNSGLAFASCKRYAMRGFATEHFLKTIIDHSATDDVILVAGNPLVDMEGITSGICEYLKKHTRNNLFVYPVTRNSQDEGLIPWLIDFYNKKDIHAIENKENIQVIAVFPGAETALENAGDWFDTNAWNRYEFTGNYVVYTKK